MSSGSIRQPPSGVAVAWKSSSKPSSGVGRDQPPRDVAQAGRGHGPLARAALRPAATAWSTSTR